jgi:hypothetical protein
MKTFTRESLIAELEFISSMGWIPSQRGNNDGAAGNTLEDLLGIEENNLPIPDASEWELKTHKRGSSSLVTLKHLDPSPRTMKLIPTVLLPKYGWPHKEAGGKYPDFEMSFRQTLTCGSRTDRGFTFTINEKKQRLEVSFDSSAVHERHLDWLQSVGRRAGLDELDPYPYWDFQDLEPALNDKLKNTFFVEVARKRSAGVEQFHFQKVVILQDFSFEKFMGVVSEGGVKIDFDARSGHNHGTKIRISQNRLPDVYSSTEVVVDSPIV